MNSEESVIAPDNYMDMSPHRLLMVTANICKRAFEVSTMTEDQKDTLKRAGYFEREAKLFSAYTIALRSKRKKVAKLLKSVGLDMGPDVIQESPLAVSIFYYQKLHQ